MPTSLRRAFEIDRLCGNTLWTDTFITECCLRQRRTTVRFQIDIDDPSILPLFSIKHHWRHRIWLCSPVTTFGVGSHH